jgi:RNA polymerase sigma-70 factor (ECF subfamily)
MPASVERDELGAIYERFGPLVRRRCQNILRDTSLAEDACQNVFVKVLRRGDAYRDAESKLGWLYRVADNCCFDMLRSRKSKRQMSLENAPDLGADDSGYERVNERRHAIALLAGMSKGLQQIAVMHYIDELSQGEIGEALGWSRQTVNAKLAKIRELARKGT